MNVPAGAGDSAYVYGKPRRKREPRRSCYLAPATGEDTAAAFDAAIDSLYAAKGFVEGDVAGRLHLVASLLAEACSRLPGAVAEARAEGLSWPEVADLLGVTRVQRLAALCRRPPQRQRGEGLSLQMGGLSWW